MIKDEYTTYDNIDRDVIMTNKDTLQIKLQKPIAHATSGVAACGWFSTSVALLTAAFLTEGFTDVLFVPGETIRGVFLTLGIISLVLTIVYAARWYLTKDTHSLEAVIAFFMTDTKVQSEPLLLEGAKSTPVKTKRATRKKTTTK